MILCSGEEGSLRAPMTLVELNNHTKCATSILHNIQDLEMQVVYPGVHYKAFTVKFVITTFFSFVKST